MGLRHDGGLTGIKRKRWGIRRKSFPTKCFAHDGGVIGTTARTTALLNCGGSERCGRGRDLAARGASRGGGCVATIALSVGAPAGRNRMARGVSRRGGRVTTIALSIRAPAGRHHIAHGVKPWPRPDSHAAFPRSPSGAKPCLPRRSRVPPLRGLKRVRRLPALTRRALRFRPIRGWERAMSKPAKSPGANPQ
jgi:hypothetical protein